VKVTQAYKYELQPSKRQLVLLSKHVGVARYAYNWGLHRKSEAYKKDKTKLSAIDLHKEIVQMKKTTEFDWLNEVSKCAPQEALRNLDSAFTSFYKRCKQGGKPGYPRFKSKHKSKDSCKFTGTILVKAARKVQLPVLGKLRTKESTKKFKGRILGATVSREADRWFVSFNVEVDREIGKPATSERVGADLGLKTFATLSDGTQIHAPKPLKKKLKQLKRRSKQHSKKQKKSNNRRKSSLRLAQLHRRIRNTRKDFINKLTTELAKTKQVIVIEDLNVSGMIKNHKLARSINDAGWGEFRKQLDYKTGWYGSELIIVDRFFPSSKICSNCGKKKKNLTLKERVFLCEACGFSCDRDLNAAINLRDYLPEVLRKVTPVEMKALTC